MLLLICLSVALLISWILSSHDAKLYRNLWYKEMGWDDWVDDGFLRESDDDIKNIKYRRTVRDGRHGSKNAKTEK